MRARKHYNEKAPNKETHNGRRRKARRAATAANAETAETIGAHMDEKLADRYWEIRLGARTRALYYSRRILFWTGLEMLAQLGEFIVSTAAFVALLENHTGFGKWAAFAVSMMSFLALWLGAGKRARKCAELGREYGLIVGDVPPYYELQTEDGARKAKDKLEKLYAEEGTFLDCLGVICYIDACHEFGATPQLRLSWIERTIGRILPIPYKRKT